jgi:hypothetical protein
MAWCGSINITNYVVAFEVRYDLRQSNWIVGVGEFVRIKIGEGYQGRGLIMGGDDNRSWVGFRWWG